MLCNRAEVLIYLSKAESISAAELALLDMLHPLAEAALKKYIHSNLGRAQHVEYYPLGESRPASDDFPLDQFQKSGDRLVFMGGGSGSEILNLRHAPVLLTGLEVCERAGAYAGQAASAFPDSSILTLGEDYHLDVDDAVTDYSTTGILRRVGSWPTEPRSVKVTYYGGWSTEDLANDAAGSIKLAAIQTVAAAWLGAKAWSRQRGPLTSEQLGHYSYTTDASSLVAISGFSSDIPNSAKMLLEPFRNYGGCFG